MFRGLNQVSKKFDWKQFPNFTQREMRCTHTGIDGITEDFMSRLQALRTAFGKPMTISSGYRHPTHPIEAKKTKPGAHSSGNACDICVSGEDAYHLLSLAIEHGFGRIGIQQKGATSSRFIHLDICREEDGFVTPTIWSY